MCSWYYGSTPPCPRSSIEWFCEAVGLLHVCGDMYWADSIMGVLVSNVVSSVIEMFIASRHSWVMDNRNCGRVIDRDTHAPLDL